MIFGSLSVSGSVADGKVICPDPEDFRELKTTPVSLGSFRGGFTLHPELPYVPEKFCFHDESNHILVLISGVIYNRKSLRDKIGINNDVTDPMLIADLFLRYGPAFAESLNGDFALFIYMYVKEEAWLYRDQSGIRPLAWSADDNAFLFSSDIYGLCRAISVTGTADREFLLGHFKYIDNRRLPEPAVHKLLPGHYIKYDKSGPSIYQYWFPERIRADRGMSYDSMITGLKSLLQDAVAIRADKRFTAGAHVSGGIDSGIVSVMTRKEYKDQEDFYGFSWTPEDFIPPEVKYDEREIIRSYCQKTGINPVFSEMKAEDMPGLTGSFYFNRGFYSEDVSINQAKFRGINLLFSGWGGDEFISTGDRAVEIDLLRHFRFRLFLRRNPVRPIRKFIHNQLNFVILPVLGKLDRRTARAFARDARYIKKPWKRSDERAIRDFYFHTSRHQMHLRMLSFYHLQDRCEIWFINGYRKGIEYRYPLLDRRIIEFMLTVPSELLCATPYFRPLIRDIGAGILPDEIRLHWDKDDHVYREYLTMVNAVSAELFMDEFEKWKANPDMDFLDFGLLEEDIERYRSGSTDPDRKLLSRLIVLIKSINEFTRHYRGRPGKSVHC